MRFTPEQMLAIERRKGELLLDAGAGSGKTSVLVERFARAVREDGIGVGQILTITFTEKAAAELRELGLLPDADPGEVGDGQASGVFASLVTRWTVEPAEEAARADRFQRDWSDVRLAIRYRFANPLYAAVSAAVADKVAPVMIEAFVEHYNHQRYHESLNNVTPADAYFGRAPPIIKQRERIKRQTIEYRRLQHRKLAA